MNQLFQRDFLVRLASSTLPKIALPACVLFASPALAEQIPINDYLETMDRTEVKFSGRIKYDKLEDTFWFYDENRDFFRVTMDAGRGAREQVETECGSSSYMASYSDLCTISGSGTIEIRGSSIYISIETVDQLNKGKT